MFFLCIFSFELALSNLTFQILFGLHYLHRWEIKHCDIKPLNLLINARRQVKIVDFEVSQILVETIDPCNSSMGTIAYMNSERINTNLNHNKYEGYVGDIWNIKHDENKYLWTNVFLWNSKLYKIGWHKLTMSPTWIFMRAPKNLSTTPPTIS